MDVVCFLKKAVKLGYVLMLLFILMDLNSTPATAQTNLSGITVDATTRTIENPFIKISWDLTTAERVDEFYFKPFSTTWNLAGIHYNEFTGGAQAFDRYEFENAAGLVNSQNTNNSWQYINNGQTTVVNIGSISDTGYQVITKYTITPDSPVIRVDRTFGFEDKALGGSRLLPYFLRAYDRDNFRRYVWEDESEMINFSENGCETGCTPDSWKQTWIDLEAPDLNVGLGLVNISPTPASELWLDRDLLSSTAFISTSIPNDGFNQDLTVSYMIVPHLGDHTAVDWDPLNRFLDLPIDYSDYVFSVAASGHIADDDERRINSWFDHSSPDYSKNNDLTKWDDISFDFTQHASQRGLSWYDGHNGIDFSRNLSQTNEYVYAAANGTVFGVVNNCGGCTTGYGNRVWIDHGNGYATLYGHLASVFVTNDTLITNRLTQSLGIMGDTGKSEGIHLHFGLYYDQDDNGIWIEAEVVDPFGWLGEGTDPWGGMTSKYLWIPSLHSQNYPDSSGGNYFTPSGFASVEIPNGALNEIITLELWDSSPAAGPLTTLRSAGNSFWMRVLEWLTGGNSPAQLTATAATNSFDVPVTVTVHYDPAMMPHLNTSQLAIKQWDDVALAWVTLPTTLDTINQQASAQTSQPGHFDLQAPLVCPVDTLEPNDNYDGSSATQVNGVFVSNLLDVNQDEDWFKFDAIVGNNYVIQTTSLSAGVDTALEIYDTDGVTLLASNDNGAVGNASSLTWPAPQDGLYFARVKQALESSYGCSSTYDFSVLDITPPTVVSSVRVNSSPTNADSVDFTVTFSEPVTGADAIGPLSDFVLTTSPGINGAFVSSLTPISETAYTVSVNTGSGNGTIRLDVVDNNSIVDAVLNPLGGAAIGDGNFTTGEVYTITKSAGGDTTGVFRPSNGLLYLKNANTTGFADVAINYGIGGDYPIAGDWNGDGTATIGIYRNGSFYLRNSNTVGFADIVFAFGTPGDQPVAGDWDGDGVDTIGVYSNGQFLLRNNNSAGTADMSFYLGNPGDVGIAGDWNGDGMDTTGVFRPSNGIIFLKNANTTGFADIALNYGLAGDMPVTGDWNNDGIDTIGVYRNAQFMLRNSNTIGFAEIVFALGNPGDMPISGNWDGIP